MSNIIDTLVTDRTGIDVSHASEIIEKIKTGTADADDIAEYMAGLKGRYNFTDFNRVEIAVNYIANLLRTSPAEIKSYADARGVALTGLLVLPYNPMDYFVTVKTDWNKTDIPTVEDAERYIENVRNLLDAIQSVYPSVPSTMKSLTFIGANAIEESLRILHNTLVDEINRIKNWIDKASMAFFYSNEIYSGEV